MTRKSKDIRQPMNKKTGVASVIVQVALWIYCSFTFLILAYMTYHSLRPKSEILSNTFGAPKKLSLDNYVKLLVDEHFFRYLGNSAAVLIVSLCLLTMIAAMTAYGIARYKFKMRKTMRIYFLIGLMFPAQLGIVPIFLMMSKMGLINNLMSVILVSSAGISMPVLMLTTFFERLPNEIYEAAIIDGAGEWKTFYAIMFPIAKPIVFSVCVTISVQLWNQFFVPLIFLQRDELKTIPLMVVKYTKNLMSTMDLAMAVSALSTIPILLIFILFSNRILDGITEGAVKG